MKQAGLEQGWCCRRPAAASPRVLAVLLPLLLRILLSAPLGCSAHSEMSSQERAKLKGRVREMFFHAYDNYIRYAFPHDELKPISRSFTDSLAELGNLKLEHLPRSYKGSALTLTDSLSSLAVLGNLSEFRKGVQWLGQHMSFDSDVRVNVFECTIRILGGLISAHLLASNQRAAPAPPAHAPPSSSAGPSGSSSTPFSPQSSLSSTPVPSPKRGVQGWMKGQESGKRREGSEAGVVGGRCDGASQGEHAAEQSRAEVAKGDGAEVEQEGRASTGCAFTGSSVCDVETQLHALLPPHLPCSCPSLAPPATNASSLPLHFSPSSFASSPSSLGSFSFSEPETAAGWYRGELLGLAESLAQRLLPAFNTPTGIPYAWVNLKHGVRPNETTETNTAGCGSLVLEFGLLSRLTGNPAYEAAAVRALRRVWGMRSPLDLVGTTLDVARGTWIELSSGIGAGVDSFYEYLLKAYVLFGAREYWDMFQAAYTAAQRHFRTPLPPLWYQDAHMLTGRPTFRQFSSLQAFWPALQVLAGDIPAANATHRQFFSVWQKYGLLPERYLYDMGVPHPSERYYPLRPELAESTYALFQATKDPYYLCVGRHILHNLNKRARVQHGYASVKDVETGQLEDHQHSFFLAEMCKYLYLLFDEPGLAHFDIPNFIFSTEGHILPVLPRWHDPALPLPDTLRPSFSNQAKKKQRRHKHSPMDLMICPNFQLHPTRCGSAGGSMDESVGRFESICHVPDLRKDHRCSDDAECGSESSSCRKRTCSPANYCGSWPT